MSQANPKDPVSRNAQRQPRWTAIHGTIRGVTIARPQAVNQPSNKDHPQRISRLKRKHQMPVVDIVPAKLMLKRDFQNAKNLPVHVILGYAEEQQSADHPPKAACKDATAPRG